MLKNVMDTLTTTLYLEGTLLLDSFHSCWMSLHRKITHTTLVASFDIWSKLVRVCKNLCQDFARQTKRYILTCVLVGWPGFIKNSCKPLSMDPAYWLVTEARWLVCPCRMSNTHVDYCSFCKGGPT